jgi:hypothetical protein
MTAAALLMLLVGLSLGLLGSGGSTITLPVLVYAAGVPAHEAVAMSLVIVGATAAFGSYLLARRGGLDVRAAGIFAATGAAGAFVGARLTRLVSEPVLLLLFGAIMAAAGARLLRSRAPVQGRNERRTLRCIVAGSSVGLLTGFLGIGGGFLIVPALLLFAGLDMRRAVPTSLAVIACNAAGGFAGQLRAVALPWSATLGYLAMAMTGMAVGTRLSWRVPASALQRVFAWGIVLMGAAIVIRNVWLLLR